MNREKGSTRPATTHQRARVRYRINQFLQGLFAGHIDGNEERQVQQVLPEAAADLFREMAPDMQRHSMNVLQTLQRAGYTNADLAAAALLHDVGKNEARRAGVNISLWMRGPLVILEALAPATLAAMASQERATGWRYALHVHFAHAAIGARWAKAAGCSPLTCWLIEHHQEEGGMDDSTPDGPYQLLAALQWADGQN